MKTLIKAGAGAGKTWTLTRQVVDQAEVFFKKQGRWPKTVVTTFTRKATQELRERVLEFCLAERPEAVAFAQSDSHLFITTIHGLLDRFLRVQGNKMGMPSQYQVVDGAKGKLLRKRILKTLFRDNENYCELLQTFDFRRLLDTFQAMEVLGLHDIPEFASKEVMESIARTRWVEIAAKMAQAGRGLIDVAPSEDWLAYGESLRIVGAMENPSWETLRDNIVLGLSSLKRPRKSKKNPALEEGLDSRIKEVIKEASAFSEAPEFQKSSWETAETFHTLLLTVFKEYRNTLKLEKIERGELEVSDLEPFAELLMKAHPEAVQQFANEWDSWFIDEFQDTSPLQLSLLKPFLENSRTFFVGDPQQSIYLFRGARSEVFLNVEKEIGALESGSVSSLQKNYRSQEAFLNFLNAFFPWVDGSFSTMDPVHKTRNAEAVCLLEAPAAADDRQLEVSGILREIDGLLKSGVPPKEIAILGRTNRDLERVAKGLSQGGYPYLSHSSAGFFQRSEIQDALALLSLLVQPKDDFRLIQFMRSPWFPMEDQTIVNLVSQQKEYFWPTFVTYFKDTEFEPGLKLLEYQNMAHRASVTWAFRQALVGFGMIDGSYALDSSGRMEANIWKLINLMEKASREPGTPLLDILENPAFAMDLDVDTTEDAASALVPDKINLMTVHASKGLQFQYVFVPFLDRKPHRRYFQDFSLDEESQSWALRLPVGEADAFIGNPLEKKVIAETARRESEESLRLFYVALTRAKEKVILSWSEAPKDLSWGRLVETYFQENPNPEGYTVAKRICDSDERPTYQWENQGIEPRKPWSTEFAADSVEKPGDDGVNLSPQDSKMFMAGQDKRIFGIWVHELFEYLVGKDGVRAIPEISAGWDGEAVDRALAYVTDLPDPPMLDLIKGGFREWGYQLKTEQGTKEGRIDLWGIVGQTLWVVDFKTGSTGFKDIAFEQLKAYAEVLRHPQLNLSFQQIKLAALFPMEEKVFVEIYPSKAKTTPVDIRP